MARGEAQLKRETPSSVRRRKNQQRSRKKTQTKKKSSKPSWTAAMKKTYIKSNKSLKDKDEDEKDEGGMEVQDEIDEETQDRLNQRQPLETQLFMKSIPADLPEAEMREFMARFGKVRRVLLVKNKVTERNAGTGFVHFESAETPKSVLKHAQQNAREVQAKDREDFSEKTQNLSNHKAKTLKYKLNRGGNEHGKVDPFVLIGDNRIFVSPVISRIESQDLAGDGRKEKKKQRTQVGADDTRNLYLVQEGFISHESPAAKDLPPQYVEMLQQDYDTRRQQLKNTNMFVSKTRLSIRNIPRKLSEKDLRKVCAEAARTYLKKNRQDLDRENFGKFGPIKNVKLLQDPSGLSRGYGFCEFVNHNVALNVLRQLNNNPTLFGPRQRLVVSFAIENINALQKLERIRERKRTRLDAATEE